MILKTVLASLVAAAGGALLSLAPVASTTAQSGGDACCASCTCASGSCACTEGDRCTAVCCVMRVVAKQPGACCMCCDCAPGASNCGGSAGCAAACCASCTCAGDCACSPAARCSAKCKGGAAKAAGCCARNASAKVICRFLSGCDEFSGSVRVSRAGRPAYACIARNGAPQYIAYLRQRDHRSRRRGPSHQASKLPGDLHACTILDRNRSYYRHRPQRLFRAPALNRSFGVSRRP